MNLRAGTVVAVTALLATSAGAQTTTPETNPAGSLAHLRLGEKLLKDRNLQDAAIEFEKAAKADREPAWTLVWSYIDLGRTLDATGQRDRAVREYQLAIETEDDTSGALFAANRYLLKAATLDEVFPLPGATDNFTSPLILRRVEPEYTAEALLARLEGSVLVSVSVAPDGAIADLHVLTPLGLGLDEMALTAVRRWIFAPGTLGGQPATLVLLIPVQFHLPSAAPGWHVTKIDFANPDGVVRPVLLRGGGIAPGKMSPELAEEAAIDAAMSRKPNVVLSMEIDTHGMPGKFQIDAASLPIWGEDAIAALGEWRFSPGTIAVPCVLELAWYPAAELPHILN